MAELMTKAARRAAITVLDAVTQQYQTALSARDYATVEALEPRVLELQAELDADDQARGYYTD